ncbi:MAG TPA: DsbA family protein [Stellaceae bacterium]|nr:DsbA family protein [Stellaceae bacterium]
MSLLIPIRLRVLLLALALAVLAFAPPASAQSAFTPAQQQELQKLIHDYLQDHPEAVIEALKAEKQKQDAATAANQRKTIAQKRAELLSDPDSAVSGNPKGDVTVVEFFDYRCPYCKQMEPTMQALIKEDTKLRVVYKEFPILGPVSVFASRVAIASRKQGKYEEFRSQMISFKGNIDQDAVMKIAASSGLDLAKLKTDMAAPDVDKIIQRNYALAETLGIDGTPGLVVGNAINDGATDLDGLRKMIAAARKGG